MELAGEQRPTVEIPDDPYDMLQGRHHLASLINEDSEQNVDCSPIDTSKSIDFWERHFAKAKEVSITSLKEKFAADYGDRISQTFGPSQRKLFENLLCKDVFELQNVVKKDKYEKFIGATSSNQPDPFFDRISAYVTAHTAMKEVFDMDSTVRLTAIQQLGKNYQIFICPI